MTIEPTDDAAYRAHDLHIRQLTADAAVRMELPAFKKKGKDGDYLRSLVMNDDMQADMELVDQAVNYELGIIKHYVLGREAPPQVRGTSKRDPGMMKKQLIKFYEMLEIENPAATALDFITKAQLAVFGRLASNNPAIQAEGKQGDQYGRY